jgi:hypothetical protein
MPAQQAYLMLARSLRRLGQPIFGLWPVTAETDFGRVPQHLATALASVGSTVGIVASPTTWWEDTSRRELSVTPLGEGVDTLSPARIGTASLGTVIERTLDRVRERYAYTLLDLSGLDAIGAQEVALVPGVGMVVFVPSGQLAERTLVKLRRRLPADRLIGAILMDRQPKNRLASA